MDIEAFNILIKRQEESERKFNEGSEPIEYATANLTNGGPIIQIKQGHFVIRNYEFLGGCGFERAVTDSLLVTDTKKYQKEEYLILTNGDRLCVKYDKYHLSKITKHNVILFLKELKKYPEVNYRNNVDLLNAMDEFVKSIKYASKTDMVTFASFIQKEYNERTLEYNTKSNICEIISKHYKKH
jgi:hypothetical protein